MDLRRTRAPVALVSLLLVGTWAGSSLAQGATRATLPLPTVSVPGVSVPVAGLTVSTPPKTVTVGGLPATQVDVTVGAKDVSLGPIPGETAIGLGLGSQSTDRCIVVAVGGHQVLITLSAQDPFAASMVELQPLVDSIVWN